MKEDLKNNVQIRNQAKRRQDFLKLQNECYLCGKALSTYLEYLPKTHRVVERTQCHNCMTLVRVKNHPIL